MLPAGAAELLGRATATFNAAAAEADNHIGEAEDRHKTDMCMCVCVQLTMFMLRRTADD